jgi:hypothetical protein
MRGLTVLHVDILVRHRILKSDEQDPVRQHGANEEYRIGDKIDYPVARTFENRDRNDALLVEAARKALGEYRFTSQRAAL